MTRKSTILKLLPTFAIGALSFVAPSAAAAQERLCDTQFEDCRTPLLNLIRSEQQGIDVAFWFMTDTRYVTELINRHRAGVPVRILVDLRANDSKPFNATVLAMLRDAGIPMRDKYTGGDILHFKMMLFAGQNVVQFSKANYTPQSFVPTEPNVSYDDEAIFFTNDDRLTNSFRRRFDDLWINTSQYRNHANVSGPLVRTYPLFSIDPSMNFPPTQNFSARAVSRHDRETQRIDAIVFRVTDHRQADAMIRAVARGVPVRIITEPTEYRNPDRVWHAKHVDRMYMGGAQIKHRKQGGLAHQASIVLYGLGEVIFGSSNWTTTSALYQDEHNFFYNPTLGKPWFFQWFADQFARKWNNTTNYVPFQPQPPGTPTNFAPGNGASGISTSVTLNWDGGNWAHLYDIYLGTTTNPPLIASNRELGSPLTGQRETFTVSDLTPGTRYYWRIVGKTWAQLTRTGPTWSFTTAGTPPAGDSGSRPYGGTPAAVPGTFQAENFDEGGQSVAYYDTSAGNTGGGCRATDVDVQATTDAGGGCYVGWTRAGEWLKYTVNVVTPGTYVLEARIANKGTATMHVEIDGVNRTGSITVPDTGAWTAYQTIRTGGISLTGGQHVVRVVFDTVGSGGASGNFNWFRFVAP
jgi:phosphatidylserine/phosphatidylglycerophosphate/cardiolipin synthase-like enzyme